MTIVTIGMYWKLRIELEKKIRRIRKMKLIHFITFGHFLLVLDISASRKFRVA